MTGNELELLESLIKATSEGLQKQMELLIAENSKAHACIFEKIETLRKDVNGLNRFKWKVIGIAGIISLGISTLVPYLLSKL